MDLCKEIEILHLFRFGVLVYIYSTSVCTTSFKWFGKEAWSLIWYEKTFKVVLSILTKINANRKNRKKSKKNSLKSLPDSTSATRLFYFSCQPSGRWYNYRLRSSGGCSPTCGFFSTTLAGNFKFLIGFWSGIIRWIWSSCIQILLEVITICIDSSLILEKSEK